jgi:hypothetical protein
VTPAPAAPALLLARPLSRRARAQRWPLAMADTLYWLADVS